MTFQPTRRSFLKGAVALALAAPAIIRPSALLAMGDKETRNAFNRAIPNRAMAFVGDSRTFQDTSVTSTEYSKLAQGYIGWLQFLSRQAFDFSLRDNYGVSGDTTRMMLARLPDILTRTNAGTIGILGEINDRSADYSFQETIDNLSTMRDLCLEAGRRVVFLSEFCRGDSTFTSQRFTSTRLAIHMRAREWLLSQRSIPGVFVFNPWQYSADITSTLGDCVLGETKDGLHQTPLGAYHQAKAGVSLINSMFPPVDTLGWSNSDVYDATNNPNGCLNSNPTMGGTAGTFNATGGSGTVADGWSENAGPTWTRVYSKIAADTNGKTWQQIVLGGTGTSSGVSTRQVISTSNIAPGDNVQAIADIEIDPSAANVSQLALQLLDNNAITAGDFRRAVSTEIFPNTTDTIRGVMSTPVYSLTTNVLQLQFNMLVVNAAAVNATVRIGRVALRKV